MIVTGVIWRQVEQCRKVRAEMVMCEDEERICTLCKTYDCFIDLYGNYLYSYDAQGF